MTTDARQQTRILVQAAVQACEDKKGADTRILELDPVDSGLSDFFLITSATNDRQSVAIADEIEHRLKKEFGVTPNSVEGRRQGEWVLLDYVDFVVHVFLTERRAFYDIERLRKSARPLTPTEFDAELKAELTRKTAAARKKAVAKTAIKAATKTGSKAGAQAKPSTAKTAPPQPKAAKKATAKKTAAKSTATRNNAAAAKKDASAKSTVKIKHAGKPAAGKASPAKKALKQPTVKKSTAKKVPAGKTRSK